MVFFTAKRRSDLGGGLKRWESFFSFDPCL
jgi:hypothetical protein